MSTIVQDDDLFRRLRLAVDKWRHPSRRGELDESEQELLAVIVSLLEDAGA